MLAGYPEAQEKFQRQFPAFIDEIDRVGPLLQRVFIRTETTRTGIDSKQIFFLGGAIYQDFQEVLLLVANGLSVGGLKILRGLYEKVVTAAYIEKNPDAARDFVDYNAIHEFKLLKRMPADIQIKLVSKAVLDRIEANFAAVKERFTTKLCECGKTGVRGSWTSLDTYSLALKVDAELSGLYGTAFVLPTLHLHPTAFDLKARTDETTSEVSMYADASPHFSIEALMAAHLLVLYMARLHNRYFSLGLNAEINDAISRYNCCWKPEP